MGLEKHLEHACYWRILPHLEKYKAEPHLDKCMPLMDPRVFEDFATKACSDVVRVVAKASGCNEAALGKELAPCLLGFATALKCYATSFYRFQQMLGQVDEVVWDRGAAIGDAVSTIFGGLAAIIVAATGGYMAGRAIDHQLQAEGQRLQEAFNVMLQAYDEAMNDLIGCAIALSDSRPQNRKELRWTS
jgi:hypothetical protein